MATLIDKILDNDNIVLTSGGLETSLVYKHKLDLPYFSCINLFNNEDAKKIIYDFYLQYVQLAQKNDVYFILDTPTWRFNKDWGMKLGYNEEDLVEKNKEATALLSPLKNLHDKIIFSGKLGPRNEGYYISNMMTVDEAKAYHSAQIQTYATTDVDLVTAVAMNYVEETLGVTLAAKEASMPLAISFTLNQDAKLPSGMTIEEAITTIDEATDSYPLFYMINCVHPMYYIDLFKKNKDQQWVKRIKSIRPNASSKSHEEVEKLTELDTGDMEELASYCKELRKTCENINIFGGCCGTSADHVEAIYNKLNTA